MTSKIIYIMLIARAHMWIVHIGYYGKHRVYKSTYGSITYAHYKLVNYMPTLQTNVTNEVK